MKKVVRNRLGFSLVELLIVIAVIALLAVVVIAQLHPLEQLKKSRDSSRLAEMDELYRAYERYFIAYVKYPWQDSSVTDPTLPDIGVAINPEFGTGLDSYLLLDRSELRPMFANRTSVLKQELWVSLMSDSRVTVCFEPESTSARNGGMGQIRTLNNTLPSPSNDCDAGYDTSTACYICVP